MDLAALLPARQYPATIWRGCRRAEAAVYRALLAGLLRCEKQIACRGCTARQIQSIYRFLKMDVPELFFVKAIRVRYPAAKPLRCTVIPEYRFTAAQARDTLLCMARSCEGLVAKHRHSSDFQKEKAIHDHIAATVRYRDADAPYSHEAPGALLFRIGVCEGIAKAFKYLADRLGLRCIVAFGAADGQAGEIGHAWNVVCVGGVFYHLDATFDATLSGSCIRYDYFNLSDADIRATHRWGRRVAAVPPDLRRLRENGLLLSARKGACRVYPKRLPRAKDHRLQAAAAPARRRDGGGRDPKAALRPTFSRACRGGGQGPAVVQPPAAGFPGPTCFERSAFSPRRGPVFPRRAPVPTFSSPFLSGTIIARKQPVQSPARQKEDKK